MPNYVQNRLTLVGKDSKKVLLSLITLDKEDKDEGDFDFEKIIRMPKSLDIESSSNQKDGLKLYIAELNPSIKTFGDLGMKIIPEEKFLKLIKSVFASSRFEKYTEYLINEQEISRLCERYKDNLPQVMELGEIAFNNLLKYGTTDWYEWRINNWGTKWNASNTYLDREASSVQFETPWSPAVPVIKKLSEQYRDLVIIYEFAEEQTAYYTGRMVFANGSVISEEIYESFSKKAFETWIDLWGEDDNYYFDNRTGTYAYKNQERDASND